MTNVTLKHDFDVELVDVAGSDEMICKAARVSTLGAASVSYTHLTLPTILRV